MIHWGIEKEVQTCLGESRLETVCNLPNEDYVVCSTKKTFLMSQNRIKITSSNIYCAMIFVDTMDMIFAVDVGLCCLSAFQPRKPTDFYLKHYQLGQLSVHQLYFDKSLNLLITIGNNIGIWKISKNPNISKLEERILIELQNTIPSTQYVQGLHDIYIDEPRSRLIQPSSNGFVVYQYDGQMVINVPNLSTIPFNSVTLRTAPKKRPRMSEKLRKDQKLIPLNLFKRFFATDVEGNLRLYHRSGQLLHLYEKKIPSIVFSEYISSEFILIVDNMSRIFIVDVKAYHVILVNDKINQRPDHVSILRNPDRLTISILNEFYVFKINLLWTLWYHPVSSALSISKICSQNLLSRFGIFSSDGFYSLVSPKGRYLIATAAVKKCATPLSVAYDIRCKEDIVLMALDDYHICVFQLCNKNQPPSAISEGIIERKVNNEEETINIAESKPVSGRASKLRPVENKDFQLNEIINTNTCIALIVKAFEDEKWCVASLGPSGDFILYEWGTWEPLTRLYIDPSRPKFAFWDEFNNTLIVLTEKQLVIISLDTLHFNLKMPIKEVVLASFDHGVLATYTANGYVTFYEVGLKTIEKVNDFHIVTPLAFLKVMYGLHIFIFNDQSVIIGDHDNFSLCTIYFPFQPTAISFFNSITLELLVAVENEIMILPIQKYFPYIESLVSPINDYDENKDDFRVVIRRNKPSGQKDMKKYQNVGTGVDDDLDETNFDSEDDNDNEKNDDEEYEEDEDEEERRRKHLKKIKPVRERHFKTVSKVQYPKLSDDDEFDNSYLFKTMSQDIKPLTATYDVSPKIEPKKIEDPPSIEKKERKPVYVIAGKIKSGEKAPGFFYKRKRRRHNDDSDYEEEEEEEEEKNELLSTTYFLEIKELRFDKEVQTIETYIDKWKERVAEERRKALLAHFAELNERNKKKKQRPSDTDNQLGLLGNDDNENDKDKDRDRTQNDSSLNSTNNGKSKKGASRISTSSKQSSFSSKNGVNSSRNNKKNSQSSKSNKNGGMLDPSLTNQNLPGDLYVNPDADAVGQRKNVISDPNGRRNRFNGQNGDYNGQNGLNNGNGRRGGGQYGRYGRHGRYGNGDDDANNMYNCDPSSRKGQLPSTIFRRIDYDNANIASLLDRLNGHSSSCTCRECCDPNSPSRKRDTQFNSYRFDPSAEKPEGMEPVYTDHHCHHDQCNCERHKDTADMTNQQEIELLPVVPPQSQKKRKYPIVIPPQRRSYSARKSPRPSLLTNSRMQEINNNDLDLDLNTSQEIDIDDSDQPPRSQSKRSILSTPEKQALWETNKDYEMPSSSFDFFQQILSPRPASMRNSNFEHARQRILSSRNTLQMLDQTSPALRDLNRKNLDDEGYTSYGAGFGYEFAKKSPRNVKSTRGDPKYSPYQRNRSNDGFAEQRIWSDKSLPPLPKVP